jgi:predicted nucleic acid-binding protein
VPDRFAIDSNVYITAFRDRDTLDQLKAFLWRGGLRVLVAGVVAAELRAGARTPEQVDALEAVLGAYAWRGRVFGTSYQAHWEAGRVLAAIAFRQKRSADFPHHLTNDALLAASCREAETVLITDNARDFTAIQRHLRGFRFVSPWPLI